MVAFLHDVGVFYAGRLLVGKREFFDSPFQNRRRAVIRLLPLQSATHSEITKTFSTTTHPDTSLSPLSLAPQLEMGSSRAKNANSILLKNLLDAAVSLTMWWLLGHR